MTAPFLPYDIPRCQGFSFEEDGLIEWREGCENCLRRLAPPHPDPAQRRLVEPPLIITFFCENLLEDPMSDLFKNRCPEAAAKQLATVLAWAAECNLATLEALQMRKSSAKCDIKRQQEICDDLVFHCNDLNVEPVGLRGHSCPRLKARMEEMREHF